MIPYFRFTEIPIGPVSIKVWGLLVAIGLLVALWLAGRAAVRRGIDRERFLDAAIWIVVAGFVGARLGHVLLYDPAYYVAHPVEILKVWHGGMSSIGAFLVSGIFGVWYLRRQHIDVWQYADAAAFGLPWGWAIGRIGCFLIHDHPGTLTHFVLAVREPGAWGEVGWARHDLGLYDAIVATGIGLVVFAVRKKKSLQGVLMLLVTGIYAIARFFLDFLRATDLPGSDARYGGLTPAQWGCLLALAFVALTWYKRKAKNTGEFA